jgi:hypothetical protein
MSSKKLNKKIGYKLRDIFVSVEKDTLARMSDDTRTEEDHITTTLFTLLEDRINKQEENDWRITARQMTGRGANSEESITGADGAVILNIKLDDVEYTKCFLFQAKNFLKSKSRFDNHAIEQKHKMLNFTPDSFFLVYTKDKISFISAFPVAVNDTISNLQTKKFVSFFEDYFSCFIGDHFLTSTILVLPLLRRHWPEWHDFYDFKKLYGFDKDIMIAKNNLFIKLSSLSKN